MPFHRGALVVLLRSCVCLALLGFVLTGCPLRHAGGRPPDTAPDVPLERDFVELKEGAGIALLLRTTPRGLELRRIAGTARPSKGELDAPRLVGDAWRERPDEDELIVTVHDERGRPLGLFGYRLDGVGFHDRVVDGRLTGNLTWSDGSDALVRVPYLRGARSLYFSRATTSLGRKIEPVGDSARACFLDVVLGGTTLFYRFRYEGALDIRDLSSAPLAIQLPPEIPGCGDGTLIFSVPRSGQGTAGGWGLPGMPPIEGGLQAGPGNVTGDFNVVVISEGFRDTSLEKTAFEKEADQVFVDLMSRRPFSLFAGKVSYYRIFGASVDSGVDHCPADFAGCDDSTPCQTCTPCCPDLAPDPHDTLLEVYGISENVGSCSNFATDDVARIFDVTGEVLDPAQVDLYIVLVNCPNSGGKAHENLPIVFLGRWNGADRPGLVAHEVAHVLAPIGEEYVSGAVAYEPGISGSCQSGCLPLISYANVATLEQLNASALPWAGLAKSGELTLQGDFPTTGNTVKNASACNVLHAGGPGQGDENEWQALGAYCGAQYVRRSCPAGSAPGMLFPCCTNATPEYQFNQRPCYSLDGAGSYVEFFRPMAFCTMRTLDEPFCRVCSCELWDVLASATGTPSGTRPDSCKPTVAPP